MTAATAASSSSQEDSLSSSDALIIPITTSSSSTSSTHNFVEIFPEELSEINSTQLISVLKDEDADLNTWAHAALLYLRQKLSRDSLSVLQTACDLPWSNRDARVRILASAGICLLAESKTTEEVRSLADQRFVQSSKVDTLFPMQWIGRGMLNLSIKRMDQAKFFFETTLKQCGQVLPALLGMAAVSFGEGNYKQAQEYYTKAITLFPNKSGAATRVGFGMACYKLGQVDRAKAAFARALQMDPENVNAMVGSAILDLDSLDENSPLVEFRKQTEKAIKKISMANLLDHSNAMVQNHLSNHYFWKWTPVVGSVEATKGSTVLKGSPQVEVGDLIRVGQAFETHVQDVQETDEEQTITMRHPWTAASSSNLKVWKKDYDRVISLAKGAYQSTAVQEMQAESLLHLARVYHVREDFDNAAKFYDRACKLAPDLSPARFGLAQTLIYQEEYDQAAAHLRLVLGTLSTATDALACLGLLEARKSGNKKEGLQYLKKAIALDPLNPNLYLLEALALQQRESDYPIALERYQKALELLESQKKDIPHEVLVNIGVLCHETKKYDMALQYYTRALNSLDKATVPPQPAGETIYHKDNSMFYEMVDTKLQVEVPKNEDDKKSLKVIGEDASSIVKGDHVQLGESFETEITSVETGDGGTVLRIKHEFSLPETTTNDDQDTKEEPKLVSVSVKRDSHRLGNPSAISIAFNLARLHEAAGRILAAVELHKAIVRRNPAYVNSYLRLACISRDCGSLKECSEWLKLSHKASPGNPEVLTLMGNLHLSLCDWAPAQSLFDQLLAIKVPNAEAYAMLSLGTIYFSNLKTPKKYSKHLQYAADYYKRILSKDKANIYAANGLGTILAEKGELFKAKEVFNRVREVSGDTVADAHLNLGHIYLAQKKHPEALQMYQSYMKKAQDSSTPITSKSRSDDIVEVLLYTAFAYFDWARQTEALNDARAAPADGLYKKCMEHLELAMHKSEKENTLLTYNYCMTKLQAANCVLQKPTRNIRRTAQEVGESLEGLEESLPKVQEILKWKMEGKKVMVGKNMLQDFVGNCKANIESARSHLEEERKKEEESNALREMQRLEAEAQRKEREYQLLKEQEEKAKKQEEQEKKAIAKMVQAEQLRATWELEAEARKAAADKKKEKKSRKEAAPGVEEEDMFDNQVTTAETTAAALFEDSDSDDEEEEKSDEKKNNAQEEGDIKEGENAAANATEKDLFGESSDEESDEELVPSGTKRAIDSDSGDENDGKDAQPIKKRRVLADEDE